MNLGRTWVYAAALTVLALGQQPNTPEATLILNGQNGPPFPIVATVEATTPASALIAGAPNVPYAIVQSATGLLQTGAATVFGDKLDLPASPLPTFVINGFQTPAFHTNALGQASLAATYPASAIGANAAYQAVIADSASPFGHSLSAATGLTVVAGAVATPLILGDEGIHNLNLGAFSVPFYGVNHSNLYISANGYMTFAPAPSDFTPSDVEFVIGPPRIAAFWCDLDSIPASSIVLTVDATSSPTSPGWVRVVYTNVQDWSFPNLHTFSMQIHANGIIQMTHAANNGASFYDQLTGIGPGNGLNPLPEKDLSAFLAPNLYAGAQNESFYQWFGLVAQHPYYTQPDDPYDLTGRTLTFVPSGSGVLPASTQSYVMF